MPGALTHRRVPPSQHRRPCPAHPLLKLCPMVRLNSKSVHHRAVASKTTCLSQRGRKEGARFYHQRPRPIPCQQRVDGRQGDRRRTVFVQRLRGERREFSGRRGGRKGLQIVRVREKRFTRTGTSNSARVRMEFAPTFALLAFDDVACPVPLPNRDATAGASILVAAVAPDAVGAAPPPFTLVSDDGAACASSSVSYPAGISQTVSDVFTCT